MDLDRLKGLLIEAKGKISDPISWRSDSSFSRWKDKVGRSLKSLFGDSHAEVRNWEKRLFGPPVMFSTTTQEDKDIIFCAAAKSAVNQLEDVVEELECLSSKGEGISVAGEHPINLNSHLFDVALSFPGEIRSHVESTANITS